MDETTTVTAEVKATTDDAVLLDADGVTEPVWVPRSVIEDGDELSRGDSGELEIATWFAEKEGL